jgi:competence protein ComEC
MAVFVFPEKKLSLVACDVGQGDAILVIYGKTQILIDGGSDNSLLDCLSSYMPFWDREIEVVLLNHPQIDHFGGLIEVFKRYNVGTFLATSLDSSSQKYQALKSAVGGSGAKIVNPTTGMVVRCGLLYLDIVHPSQQFLEANGAGYIPIVDSGVLGAFTFLQDPNEFSVVAILSLGEFNALLTGNIGPEISNIIAKILVASNSRSIEYIKIPHHSSKNGLSPELLDVTRPEVAVISVGKENRYGRPHEEILKILGDKDIKILRTNLEGDIEVVSDGKNWWVIE